MRRSSRTSGVRGLDAHLLPPPDVLGVYVYLPDRSGVVSSLAAFRLVRTVGTVLPAEALTRAVDLRMPGQSAAGLPAHPGHDRQRRRRPCLGGAPSAPTAPGRSPWPGSPAATRQPH